MRMPQAIAKPSSRKGESGMIASIPKLTARVRPAEVMARDDSGTALTTASRSSRRTTTRADSGSSPSSSSSFTGAPAVSIRTAAAAPDGSETIRPPARISIRPSHSRSRGCRPERSRTRVVPSIAASARIVATGDTGMQTGREAIGHTVGYELFDRYDVEELARAASQRARTKLAARPAPTGEMPVVIGPGGAQVESRDSRRDALGLPTTAGALRDFAATMAERFQVDADALENLTYAVSRAILADPRIRAVEVNPAVSLSDGRLVAVDALIDLES